MPPDVSEWVLVLTPRDWVRTFTAAIARASAARRQSRWQSVQWLAVDMQMILGQSAMTSRFRKCVRRRGVVVAFVLGGLPAALASQSNGGPMPAGTRVRVTAPSSHVRDVGTLIPAGDDTIALVTGQRSHGRVALPRSAVTRFEVSRDRQSAMLAGAIWGSVGAPLGALAGAMTGFVAVAQLGDGCERGISDQECRRESDGAARRTLPTAAVIGAVVGVVAGAVYGTKHRRERWQLVDMPLRVAVVVPSGVAASFAFGRP